MQVMANSFLRFSFPGIFIFYQIFSLAVSSILFILSNYVDFKNLMCGSNNLIKNLVQGNETPLCVISGMLNISNTVIIVTFATLL